LFLLALNLVQVEAENGFFRCDLTSLG